MTYNQKALKQYQSVDSSSAVEGASPHQLILMLLDGALAAMLRAKGMIEQKGMEEKGKQINKATQIVVHLKGSLDHEKGGEVAAGLDRVYDLILDRLMRANRHLDIEALDEAAAMLAEIKQGWSEMPDEHKS